MLLCKDPKRRLRILKRRESRNEKWRETKRQKEMETETERQSSSSINRGLGRPKPQVPPPSVSPSHLVDLLLLNTCNSLTQWSKRFLPS